MTFPRSARQFSLVALAVALLGSLACSHLRVTTQLAPGASLRPYGTFAFFDARLGGTGSLDPAAEPRLEALLRDGLVGRGFVYGTDTPDLVVRYATLAEDYDAHTTFGYLDAGHGWETGFGAGVDMVQPYKKGSLMVDLLDARTHRLVWRGVAEGAARPGTDARGKVRRALAQMFRDLTPGG